MENSNDKFLRFAEVINKNADAKCRIIEKQTKKIKEREEAKISEITEKETDNLLRSEERRLENEINSKLAKISSESKKQLVEHREKITNEIFEKVKEKILAFTQGDRYRDFFAKELERAVSEIGRLSHSQKQIIVQVRKQDLEIAEKICDKRYALETSDEILLGGFVVTDGDRAIQIDDSFDGRLAIEKEKFKADSKLSVTKG